MNMTFYQFLYLLFAIVKRTFIDKPKSDKIDSYRVQTDFQCVAKELGKLKKNANNFSSLQNK